MAYGFDYKQVQDVRDKYIEVDGLTQFMRWLHAYNMTNQESDIVKRTRQVIAQALRKARQLGITKLANEIPNNQRRAELALRSRVYSKRSQVLGGNISLLRSHRNGNSSPRPIPPTKSGKPREWSKRTRDIWGYQGEDAQFILYWLAQGTNDRMSGLWRADKHGNYTHTSGILFSQARKKYFGGTHHVGRIEAGKINPNLYDLLERVVDGEIIPELDKLWQEYSRNKQ